MATQLLTCWHPKRSTGAPLLSWAGIETRIETRIEALVLFRQPLALAGHVFPLPSLVQELRVKVALLLGAWATLGLWSAQLQLFQGLRLLCLLV